MNPDWGRNRVIVHVYLRTYPTIFLKPKREEGSLLRFKHRRESMSGEIMVGGGKERGLVTTLKYRIRECRVKMRL